MKKGFTLIELLVVVAIIGILASVVLANLTTSRKRGLDAAIKEQLISLRSAAEVIYSTTGSYDTVCDPASNAGVIYRAAFAQGLKDDNNNQCNGSNTTTYGSVSGVMVATPGAKPASPEKWGAIVHLQNGNYFCVDYTGYGKEDSVRILGGGSWTNCQ